MSRENADLEDAKDVKRVYLEITSRKQKWLSEKEFAKRTGVKLCARKGGAFKSEFRKKVKRKMSEKKHFTVEEAKKIGDALRISWHEFDVDQFRRGMDVELEHGTVDADTNVTNDDALTTGKIALAHLREFPDYYDRLEEMEKAAEAYWEEKNKNKK